MTMTARPLACWICGKAVDLNTCKTDERGLALRVVLRRPNRETRVAPSVQSRRLILNLTLTAPDL